jgi:hypothetical protein
MRQNALSRAAFFSWDKVADRAADALVEIGG